ncbi:hypothetical protein KGF54_004313 [Candida jiufengensis]|uniref:uncharacterized protein n=1 Tax=Candida jiufengensis TaxID=497108 RepID=UPI002225714E|nr:uncharacterized protein KGF54_004313 [Candida jiufengensis]KAI5951239.1 hypothetical protein KGF54_004313 [Candida jiufengensis]
MNILRQTKAIKDISLLEKPINAFIRRVGQEQSKNSGPLLKCIDSLINQNQSKLIERFKLHNIDDEFELKQQLWDNLKTRRTDLDPKLIKRLKHQPPTDIQFTTEYNKFIKELYPLNNKPFKSQVRFFDLESNHKKYDNINHEKLFKKYLELPKPAPQYLPPSILKDFISKFVLNNRHFANRNILEGSIISSNKAGLIKSMRNEINRRKEYHDMCLKVLNDSKKAGFDATEQEQIRIIYLSFFKDRQDLVGDLEGENLYNEFTMANYQSILQTFGRRSDLLGILLFLAIRHDKFEIIADVLPQVGLGHIIGLEDVDNFKLIDISLINLLDYFTTHIDRPNHFKYLSNTIEQIIKLPVITNEIVDQTIKLLMNFGLIKHAEILFETAYFRYPGESSNIISEWLYIFTKLKAINNDNSTFYKLSPTHSSFLHLIKGYSMDQPFDKIEQLMYIMNNMSSQRSSTTMYIEIFKGLKHRDDWKLYELRSSLKLLVNDLNYKNNAEVVTDNSNSGLRISNLLMELVFTVSVDKLHLEGDSTNNIDQLNKLKLKWQEMVKERKIGAFEAERIAYINDGFLLEVYNILVN